MTGILYIQNGNYSRKGGEQTHYCYTKVWRVKPVHVYQQVSDLIPLVRTAGKSILLHFRSKFILLYTSIKIHC